MQPEVGGEDLAVPQSPQELEKLVLSRLCSTIKSSEACGVGGQTEHGGLWAVSAAGAMRRLSEGPQPLFSATFGHWPREVSTGQRARQGPFLTPGACRGW